MTEHDKARAWAFMMDYTALCKKYNCYTRDYTDDPSEEGASIVVCGEYPDLTSEEEDVEDMNRHLDDLRGYVDDFDLDEDDFYYDA